MRLAFAIVWLLVSVVAEARAEVDCPQQQTLRAALDAEGVDPQVQVSAVAVDGGGVRLRATRDAEVIVDRVVPESKDCEALAEALALIVSIRLVEFAAAAAPAAAAAGAAPAAAPAAGARQVSGPSNSPDDRSAPVSSVSRRSSSSPASSADSRVSVALLASFARALGSEAHASAGELELAFTNRRGRGLRLSLARDAGASMDQVDRTAWTARAELTAAARSGRAWVRAGAGAALVASRIGAESTMANTLRSHPAVTASTTGGFYVSRRVSLRLDLAAALFPVVDRYRISGGEVSRSPRALFGIGLGAQIDTGW